MKMQGKNRFFSKKFKMPDKRLFKAKKRPSYSSKDKLRPLYNSSNHQPQELFF